MSRREKKIFAAALVLGIGVGMWVGAWIAPIYLFYSSYLVMQCGLFLFGSAIREKP